jgi:aspartate carbamoyltransferase catalytic subunit
MTTNNTTSNLYARAEVSPPSGSLFPHDHILGIWEMDPTTIKFILDTADRYAEANRAPRHSGDPDSANKCNGLTQINLFFENSTRTLMSFEIAGKRLGMDTISMSTGTSSIKKGETLLDTAATLNAMRPDILVMRHGDSGAVKLLSEKMECAVINAGDGRNEHPTQAFLDALTIRRRKGQIHGQTIVVSGDITHSRVARSNIYLLNAMGARVRLVAPPTLLPKDIGELGVEVFTDMNEGLKGADVVMMLRLQQERMKGAFLPSLREYYRFWGLTREKLEIANDDVLVMHPGPMNRGVEIASDVADDLDRSAIEEQVEMGVAVRMACLDILTRKIRGEEMV